MVICVVGELPSAEERHAACFGAQHHRGNPEEVRHFYLDTGRALFAVQPVGRGSIVGSYYGSFVVLGTELYEALI